MQFIDLKSQYRRIKADVDARIARVLEGGAYVMGPEVQELEAALAQFCGAPHAVAVSSGTDALLICMMALGIGPGDEVVTTPFTFIATAEMIALLGAKPVFVDVEADTGNLDARLLPAALTSRTRLIVPVSLYGQCADMADIVAVGDAHGLPVLEDAAQSFGARHGDRWSCNLSTLACTSFYPAKPLGCYGDGGACFTADDELARRMRQIRDHGQSARYEHARLGLNGRLDTLQAAVLLAKLAIFPDELAARARVATRYTELIAARRPRARPLTVAAGRTSAYAQYTVEVDDRARVIEELKARGIPTAVHYPKPLHLQPVFRNDGQGTGAFPVAESLAERVLSLPMHPYLDDAEQCRVIDALTAVCGTRG